MAVTVSQMEADIEAELDAYFATTSGSIRPDFAAFLTNLIVKAVQDGIANYAAYTTTVTSTPILVAPPGGGPVTGTITNSATTTAACTIP